MIKNKIIGIIATGIIGLAVITGANQLTHNKVNTNTKIEYSSLLAAPNYSVRLANYVSSESNRESAWNEAVRLHNGSEMNNCTLWVSSCLRGAGENVPYNIAYTTDLGNWLGNNGWTRGTNLNNLQRGDICFASNVHAFIFLSWYNQAEGLANVVDEQAAFFTPNAASYVRNLNGTNGNGWVPGDTQANDSYSGVTYFMSDYPTGSNVGATQQGWVNDNGTWYYNLSNGSLATGFNTINGSEYYFNDNGAMQTGWNQINGNWYYMGSSGAVNTGWTDVNGTWYYMNNSGVMQTGWINDNGTWYYMNSSGAMQTGWADVNGTWYYMNNSGAMQTGWVNDNGTWYYMNNSGAMQTGWADVNGTWYYMNSSGAMQTGWVNDNGTWYYMNSSGAMAANSWVDYNNNWYYMTNSGAMNQGWLQYKGGWYFTNSQGVMLTGTQVINGKSYTFNSNGALV
ncbi:MAG: hypothetical protein ACRC41_03650 [Sarcina sp.]